MNRLLIIMVNSQSNEFFEGFHYLLYPAALEKIKNIRDSAAAV